MFCSNVESIEHLFFSCSVARYVWSVMRCAFMLKSIPIGFYDLPRWLETFRVEDRFLILTGVASLIWAIWKTRNNACFNRINPQDPTFIIFMMSYLISYWAGLQRPNLRKTQCKGASLLVLVATEVFHRKQGSGPIVLRLADS